MDLNPLLSDLIVESYLAERRKRAALGQWRHLAEANHRPLVQKDARPAGSLLRRLGEPLARLGSWFTRQPSPCGQAHELSSSCCSPC